jgi:hypothetical protein
VTNVGGQWMIVDGGHQRGFLEEDDELSVEGEVEIPAEFAAQPFSTPYRFEVPAADLWVAQQPKPFIVAEAFTNKAGKVTPLAETIRSFEELCDGKWDHLPEGAFLYVGAIEEAAEQAKDAGKRSRLPAAVAKAVEATLDILGRMQKKKDDIAEIVVETAPGGQALRTVEPETVLAAKFSLPHAIAATVQLGTAGARAFTQDKLEDADISKLRKRVRLQPYPDVKPAPNDRPARVTMRFNDGAEMSAVVESARGGYDKPFDEPTLLSKLGENAGAIFPAVPETLKKVIAGDKALLSQGWKETLAAMVKS